MTQRVASCSCGQLTATTTEEPIRVSVCHCLACQRRTGSTYGIQARFTKAQVTIVGDSKQYVRIGDEGRETTFNFCPNCGATVHYLIEGRESDIAIPVGTFRLERLWWWLTATFLASFQGPVGYQKWRR